MVQETTEGLVTGADTPPAAQVETAMAEKLLPQSEVNSLIGSTRSKAHAKGMDAGRQEGYELAKNELASQAYAEPPVQPAPVQAGVQPASTDDLRNHVHEVVSQMYQDAQQQEHQNQIQQAHHNVTAKILNDTQEIPGFVDKLAQNGIDLSQPSHLTQHLSQVDNPGAVLNEIVDNPQKFATLNALPPAMAAHQIKILSDGIKTNQQPVNLPNTPLSAPSPSMKGTDSGAENPYDRISHLMNGG